MSAPQRVIDRIRARTVMESSGCWTWTGAQNGVGYGRIAWSEDGKMQYALTHRVMYEDAIGSIPDGTVLDHTCHGVDCPTVNPEGCPHRSCCNPAHLEPVSQRENLLRGATMTAARRATTHCPQGHEYNDENTIVSNRGQRECKTCRYEKNRAYYWKNRERRREYNRQWRAANA